MRKMSMVVSLLLVSGIAAAHTGINERGRHAAAPAGIASSAVRMEQAVMVAARKRGRTAHAAPKVEAPQVEMPAPAETGAYTPKTEFDNTPYRFNMNQNGKRMTAEEFDAWMKSRGIRVATGGAPAANTQPAAAAQSGGTQAVSGAKGK